MKTLLLVAAALLVGASNAWGGDVTTLYERGTTNAWVAADLNDWTVTTATSTTIDGGIVQTGTNAGYSVSKTISPTDGTIVKLEASFTGGVAPGRDTSYDYITIGGASLKLNGQNSKATIDIDGVVTNLTGFSRGGTYNVVVTINQTSNVVSFTVSGAATGSVETTSATAIGNVTIGHYRGGRENYASTVKLLSIKLTEETQSATYANYTVHFVDNKGATVKNDEVRNGEVGSTVNANSADKTTFTSGDYKYVYSSDGEGVKVTSDGSAELTVTYKKLGKYTYSVYAVNSSSEKLLNDPIATATPYEEESVTLAWSKYINVSGTWYGSSESTFTATATKEGSKNVTYTPVNDFDYFFEFENLTKSGSFAATQSGDDLSNNNSARFAKNSRAWTTAISAGTYTLKIYCYGTNGKTPTLPIYYCDTDGSNPVYIAEATATAANEWDLREKTGVVIPEGKALCFYNTDASNNSNYLVDYFTLTRTGDATIPATITAAGWATLYTPYALNFAAAEPKGLEAYTATLNGSTVTLTKVDDIPANTGVVLKGGANTYSIPVIASSETPQGSLKGSTTEAKEASANSPIYILKLNANNEAQFMCATYGSLDAGKAYLELTSQAKALNVVFANDPTGIATVNAAEATQPVKRIVNGQLVIEKNGKRYNAAGAEF